MTHQFAPAPLGDRDALVFVAGRTCPICGTILPVLQPGEDAWCVFCAYPRNPAGARVDLPSTPDLVRTNP